MALLASQQWWVRTDGNELNGGGYDSTISGAGTNYSDQASPQLSLTDVVTTGTTTVISVTGGFTTAMIGNIIRIAGDGYYAITARTNTNTISVDRATGTATGQSARIGGAHASMVNYSTGSFMSAPSPLLASPLAIGNIINMRGSGSLDPSPASIDYDFSAGFWTFPTAGGDNKPITLLGYNGRPQIGANPLWHYASDGWMFRHLKMTAIATDRAGYGFIFSSGSSGAEEFAHKVLDSIFEQNGNDIVCLTSPSYVQAWFKNTGSTSAGSNQAIYCQSDSEGVIIEGSLFTDLRGPAFLIDQVSCSILHSIVARNHASSYAACIINYGYRVQAAVDGCVFDSSVGDGLKLDTYRHPLQQNSTVQNSCFSNNGGYGLNYTYVSTDVSAEGIEDYNVFYNNTSGATANQTLGAHDLTVNPQYVNASGNDFTPQNTALTGAALPLTLGSATNYAWIGAIQPQGSAPSGGGNYPQVFE